MDLVTQGLLGATLAEAGWRRQLGPSAIGAGAILGLLPDADVLSRLGGEWKELIHHRGFTHSIFFAPLMAPLAGHLCWKLSGERASRRSWGWLAFWALLTHPLLDIFTTYGTQFFYPLSRIRLSLDGISIIDPLYTLPLVLVLILCGWQRRQAHQTETLLKRHALWARWVLGLTTLYLGVGVATSQWVRHQGRVQLKHQHPVALERIRAMPTFGNLLLWRVVAQDQNQSIIAGHYALLPAADIGFSQQDRPEHPLIDQALKSRRGQDFQWFADGWLSFKVEESEASTCIHMRDQRYGSLRRATETSWGARFIFNRKGQLVSAERAHPHPTEVDQELQALWHGIWQGPDPQPP